MTADEIHQRLKTAAAEKPLDEQALEHRLRARV